MQHTYHPHPVQYTVSLCIRSLLAAVLVCNMNICEGTERVACLGVAAGSVPSMFQTMMLFYPYIYNAVYGRFLLLQLSKSSSVMALNYLIVLLSVIGHLASRNADNMLLRIIYGRRTAQVPMFRAVPCPVSCIYKHRPSAILLIFMKCTIRSTFCTHLQDSKFHVCEREHLV